MPRKRPLEDKNQYYAYVWRYRKQVLYVGQGKDNRGRVGCKSSYSGRPWRLLAWLEKNWMEVTVEIFPCNSKQESWAVEARLIKKLKPKYNKAPHHGGYKGMHSKEAIEAIRLSHLGVKWDDPARSLALSLRLKDNQFRKGVKHSKKVKLKIGKALKGRKPSALARQKASERMRERNLNNPPRKGKKCSEIHKNKVRLAALGRKPSKATQDKLRTAMNNRKRDSFGRITKCT